MVDDNLVPVRQDTRLSPKQPIREANGEDLSDLFNVRTEDVMGDTEEGIEQLTDVNDEDVFGEGGEDMSDLTDVESEDLEGLEGYDYAPQQPKPVPPVPRFRVNPNIRRMYPQPPPNVGGLR